MDKVAQLKDYERSELFRLTAEKMRVTEAIIEKDFWACYVLKAIFESQELSEVLLFKGGTSLSKCYNLIHRFSEDIDLILDWRKLNITDDKAWQERSTTQQNRFNAELDQKGRVYIQKMIFPTLGNLLNKKIGNNLSLEIDESDGHVVRVHYPQSFPDKYMLNFLKLEIGPRASRIPLNEVVIESYTSQVYPAQFTHPSFTVKVIKSERTFWEKATILHQIASNPEDKAIPPRHSRHYYDLFQMMGSSVKDQAMANLQLLEQVRNFKARFYPSTSARYDLAKPGTLRLVPSKMKCKSLEDDYHLMKEMIYGKIPEFNDVLDALKSLESEINNAALC